MIVPLLSEVVSAGLQRKIPSPAVAGRVKSLEIERLVGWQRRGCAKRDDVRDRCDHETPRLSRRRLGRRLDLKTRRLAGHSRIRAPGDRIGILNHLFFWPEQYRRTGGMSIVFLFDENPDVASAGSGGAAVGGARSVPDHAARSNSERAAPSARVGNRFSAPQIVWNRSNRCAGERGGARVGRPRWANAAILTQPRVRYS